MAMNNGVDTIFLIWKDANSHRNYTIGTLKKYSGYYSFKYSEIDIAIKNGFDLLPSFADKETEYVRSNTLFPVFSCRLPDRRRRDIEDILSKYNLNSFDEFEFLKRSGGKLPTDNLFFIDPIFQDESYVTRSFPVAGARHYVCKSGNNCSDLTNCLSKGEKLALKLDPTNEKDDNAIKIMYRNDILGYVPRYYSEEIARRLRLGSTYDCKIIAINSINGICDDCIKVSLYID